MAYTTEELLSRFDESDLTQKAFCREAGVSVSALQYHLQKRKRARSSAAESRGAFVPLQVRGRGIGKSTVIILRGEFAPGAVSELIKSLED